MGSNSSKSVEEQTQTLNAYFEYKHDLLQFKRDPNEINDIYFAVDHLVRVVTREIGDRNSSLRLKRIVRVGSMQEGTKIREPREFDYLLVLDNLSRPGDVVLRRNCKNGRGFAHVELCDRQLISQWSQCTEGNMLKCGKTSYVTYALHRLFGYDIGFGEVFYNTLYSIVGSRPNISDCQMQTGKMCVKGGLWCHGPAFTTIFRWTPKDKNSCNLDISVDLTPAIDQPLTDDIVSESDVYDYRFYQALKRVNTFMVVPSNNKACGSGQCFRLTFTEAELELFRFSGNVGNNPYSVGLPTIFDPSVLWHHIKCYKVLKYLFEGTDEKPEMFQSYVMKTLVLKHLCHCSRVENMAHCINELLDDCLGLVKSYNICVGNIFIKELCVLQNKVVRASLSTLRHSIERLKKSLVKVANCDDVRKASVTKPHSIIYHYTNFYTSQGLGIYLDSWKYD